jgi:hypothetical protein
VPKLYGKVADEAEELARKARAIKIPIPRRKHLEVEYTYEDGNRFCGFAFGLFAGNMTSERAAS